MNLKDSFSFPVRALLYFPLVLTMPVFVLLWFSLLPAQLLLLVCNLLIFLTLLNFWPFVPFTMLSFCFTSIMAGGKLSGAEWYVVAVGYIDFSTAIHIHFSLTLSTFFVGHLQHGLATTMAP